MNEIQQYQPKPRNAMMIKNLCPGLMEMGKIKIGNKGSIRKTGEGKSWQAPQKLDHFLITTMQRGEDNNFLLDTSLHNMYGESPKSIPVRLIYDDISLNFATRYICYYGKTVFCSGDGEEAQRLQQDRKTYQARTCPCERQDPKFAGDDGKGKGKCKINGILSVIIDGAECVGGVWKFRTTSYNSVVGILSSLAMIQRITGGRLAGIPLTMTVTPKTVQDPIQGSQQTIYVVGLQYAGTMDTLRDTGYQIAMNEAKHGISMARIEEDARLMLTHTPSSGLGDDSDMDVIEEFYPEEARPGAPDLVSATPVTVPSTAESSSDDAPPLVGVTEAVDMATGEVIEAQPVHEQPKQRTRRTKAQIEADRLEAEKAQQPAESTDNAAGPVNAEASGDAAEHAGGNGDDGPAPPDVDQLEDSPHPAEDQGAAPVAGNDGDGEQTGDLF